MLDAGQLGPGRSGDLVLGNHQLGLAIRIPNTHAAAPHATGSHSTAAHPSSRNDTNTDRNAAP